MLPNGERVNRMKTKHYQLPLPKVAVFPRLEDETREVVPTDCAAYHLNRQPQTLREWACLDKGLLRPVRIGNRLGWRTEDIRRLVCGEASE